MEQLQDENRAASGTKMELNGTASRNEGVSRQSETNGGVLLDGEVPRKLDEGDWEKI